MRLLLLAADFGVLPPANSPSVDFMLWLTACRPNVRGETCLFIYFNSLIIYYYFIYMFIY